MQRVEAAFKRTRPQRRPGPYRIGDTPEFAGPKVLKLEQIAEQFPRALGDDDRVRPGDALQAGCKVRCLANDAALLRLARPDQVADYDQPGGNANTGLQGSASSLQITYGGD